MNKYIIIFILVIFCIFPGCKSSKDNTVQPDTPKAETTQETATNTNTATAENDDTAKQPIDFKTLEEADQAFDTFMKEIQAIAERNEGNCDASAQAIDKYYQENAEKLEKSMMFASQMAQNDTEKMGEIFSFFRSIENAISGATEYTEKLDPCEDNALLNSVWDKIRKLLEKYEPDDIANEGTDDE